MSLTRVEKSSFFGLHEPGAINIGQECGLIELGGAQNCLLF